MLNIKINTKLGRIIAFVVAAVLLITLTCLVPSAESRSATVNEDGAFLSNQALSNDAYNLLLRAFADEGNGSLLSYFPDYYAGAYIDSEGHLVILTNNANESDLKRITDICKNDDILFETAKYSYNELIEIKGSILKRGQEIMENDIVTNEAFSVGIRDNENKVYVTVSDPADIQLREYLTQDLKATKVDFDTDAIVFDKAEKPRVSYITLTPGDDIYSYQHGSVAFKAQLTYGGTTRTGFVTAGHVTNGQDAYWFWWDWGKCGDTIVEQVGGNADAAFCELVDNSFTNTVNGYAITSGLYVIPAVGSTVYKIGMTTGTTSGTTVSNMVSGYVYMNGQYVYLTNQIQATNQIEEGDSGGLLYSISGSSARVVGITSNGDATYSYYSIAALMPWDIWPTD